MGSKATTVLVVGATRGLGAEIAKQYAAKTDHKVYATARSSSVEDKLDEAITWICGVDISSESAGDVLSKAGYDGPISILIVSAGYFGFESFDEPSYDAQLRMYKTSAIGPVFVVQKLVKAGLLSKGSKVMLITSESGSIGLRHESEGGGNYGHHASKTALNMVGKLLSLDLKDRGIAVGLLHPGFMRTEMTKSVGFDKYWDDGGAVTPAEAAESLIEFTDTFDITHTGEYWAPRGPADIGTVEATMGPKDKLPTPLQLPW